MRARIGATVRDFAISRAAPGVAQPAADEFDGPCIRPPASSEPAPQPSPPATAAPSTAVPRATPPAVRDAQVTFTITGPRRMRPARSVALSALCRGEPCKLVVRSRLRLPRARGVALATVRATLKAGVRRRVTLRLSRGTLVRLRRALRTSAGRRSSRLTVTATATDAAGNRASRTLVIRFRR